MIPKSGEECRLGEYTVRRRNMATLERLEGNKAKLTVKGLKAGSTTVEIYNAKDKTQKVTLKVTVKKK